MKFILILVCSCFFSVSSAGCPSGFTLVNGICLFSASDKFSSSVSAQEFCEARNSSLIHFYNQIELDSTINYLVTSNGKPFTIWVGIWNYASHSSSNPGYWTQNNGTGTVPLYANWDSLEPSDFFGNEKCAVLFDSGKLNDVVCGNANLSPTVCIWRPPTCPVGYALFNTTCYYMSMEKTNGPQAGQAICQKQNGSLVSFRDVNEYESLLSFLKLAYSPTFTIYINHWNYQPHSVLSPGIWRENNSTTSSALYTKWSSGEPNDYGGSEPCAVLTNLGTMNDAKCVGSDCWPTVCVLRGESSTTTTTTTTRTTTTTLSTSSSTAKTATLPPSTTTTTTLRTSSSTATTATPPPSTTTTTTLSISSSTAKTATLPPSTTTTKSLPASSSTATNTAPPTSNTATKGPSSSSISLTSLSNLEASTTSTAVASTITERPITTAPSTNDAQKASTEGASHARNIWINDIRTTTISQAGEKKHLYLPLILLGIACLVAATTLILCLIMLMKASKRERTSPNANGLYS